MFWCCQHVFSKENVQLDFDINQNKALDDRQKAAKSEQLAKNQAQVCSKVKACRLLTASSQLTGHAHFKSG